MTDWSINEWAALVTIAAALSPAIYKIMHRFGPPKLPSGTYKPRHRFKDREDSPEMIVVPRGIVKIGSPEDEYEREGSNEIERDEYLGSEGPRKDIQISKELAIGIYPVTVKEFRTFVATQNHTTGVAEIYSRKNKEFRKSTKRRDWRDPGFPQGDDHPVVGVSWLDAQAYCSWLSSITGHKYRLPSAAEWEHAARARSDTPFWWGDHISPHQANYDYRFLYRSTGDSKESPKGTCAVKQFSPNSFGLYQVHGNVWEHCEDSWSQSLSDVPNDGTALKISAAEFKVCKGGSFLDHPAELRSAFREAANPDGRWVNTGFRVVREI